MGMRSITSILCLLNFFFGTIGWANDTCSRTAIVNYQEIMVDQNSGLKGEGLRFHLEKDPKALSYLNVYQKNAKNKIFSTVMGTIGTSSFIAGLFIKSENDQNKPFLIGGLAILALNFLISKSLELENEQNLEKAIKEYNKRNLPRIYFTPNLQKDRNPTSLPGIGFEFVKDF